MSAYVLYSCGCSLDVSAPCRLTQLLTADHAAAHFRHLLRLCEGSRNCSLHAPAPWMRRLTSYNRSLAPTAHFMQAEDCMRMTENLGGLCMNCARTAWTPGVGAAHAGSQAHAGLRDRLCLESRATFARNEQTRLGGGTRSALSAGAAWCWSVALDTRREELVTPRGQALQEHA